MIVCDGVIEYHCKGAAQMVISSIRYLLCPLSLVVDPELSQALAEGYSSACSATL